MKGIRYHLRFHRKPLATCPVAREVVSAALQAAFPGTAETYRAIALPEGYKAFHQTVRGSRTFVGDEATEENAKAVAGQADYLHFACHGLIDRRIPLNSALALSIPGPSKAGRDNGLLQAWEIFEKLRIHADLVVLSACETALGKDMGGEGLDGHE